MNTQAEPSGLRGASDALRPTSQKRAACAIEITGLGKKYGDKPVLDNVSFSVPWGQICGYLGPNGAGKSTTIKALAGIAAPDAGTLRINGHDVFGSGLDAKRQLGYVPESGGLYGLLTVGEHIDLVGELHELPEDTLEQRKKEVLEGLGLEKLTRRRIDSLSKGQRQKTLLATALLHEPDVLLLDEPLDGLDVTAVRQIKDLLLSLARSGRTILFCSHILDVVERICDRAIILDHGRIVADAPTKDLVARSADRTLESVFHALVRSDAVGLSGLFTDGEAK